MTDQHIHIITHDIPWPANHGGLIDLYCKIKSLHQIGINIHLHCFTQGRPPQEELNKYCFSVNYYQRKKNFTGFSFRLPYIVNSRANDELLKNLQKDQHPILMEGIHCTYYLHKGMLDNRKIVIRLHNVEFEYYRQLASHEKNILKKLYYLHESKLLYRYEQTLSSKACFLTVSKQDDWLYRNKFGAADIHYLPVFIPYSLSVLKENKGCYCLYHGNLSINENEAAVKWLLKNVFAYLKLPLVIAGKDPSKELLHLAHEHPNTCLVPNPSDKEMQDLITKAQINILPSFNSTGVKLKLLNALLNGRHCLVNPAAVDGTNLSNYCHIATDINSFHQKIIELYDVPFSEQDQLKRQALVKEEYNNEVNAKKLMQFL